MTVDLSDNPFLAGAVLEPAPIEKARAARMENVESERVSLLRRAREARLDDEKRRIVNYCVKEIEKGRPDVAHLKTRIEEILRENERRRR